MNRLEFNEILKITGVSNPVLPVPGGNPEDKVHLWGEKLIYFSGTYYAVVKGKIPLEVANNIWEKYPNNPYYIRINGGNNAWVPDFFAVDDQYEKDLKNLNKLNLSSSEFQEMLGIYRKELRERDNENKYIKSYHIDTKEGLAIFIIEMKNYFRKKQGLEQLEQQEFDRIMEHLWFNILTKINPTTSNYDWISKDKIGSKIYNETIARDNNNDFNSTLRELINKFDKTVNPYINNDIELNSIDNYLKKVNITGNSFKDGDRNNCCTMVISAKNAYKEVTYTRNNDGFSYKLNCALGRDEYLLISHYFTSKDIDDRSAGEYIYINYYDNDSEEKINSSYNITRGLFKENGSKSLPITQLQMDLIYNKLIKAVDIASTVTIENMTKQGITKKKSK